MLRIRMEIDTFVQNVEIELINLRCRRSQYGYGVKQSARYIYIYSSRQRHTTAIREQINKPRHI